MRMYRITGREKHWELDNWNYTRKHWEWGQGDSWESSHCFSRYYSWALFFLVPRDETGWGWDHGSNGDDSDEMVRLHYPLARQHAVPGVRGSNEGHWRPIESLHL